MLRKHRLVPHSDEVGGGAGQPGEFPGNGSHWGRPCGEKGFQSKVCAMSRKGKNVGRGEKARDGILNYERVKSRARPAFKPVSRNLDFILTAVWCG